MANEYLAGRIAIDNYTLSGGLAATTMNNGVQIPGGIMVTGVSLVDDAALTVAGDMTLQPAIINTVLSSTQYFIKTLQVSDLPAQTVITAGSLLTAGGVYIAQPGELAIVMNSSAEALTWSPTLFVGYVDIA